MVSKRAPPLAKSAVRYVAPAANLAEIREFKLAVKAADGDFADGFMTAPSPGMIASAMHNRHYPDEDSYLDALAEALAVEYRAAVEAGLLLQIDAPDLAMERHISYGDEPLDAFLGFARRGCRPDQHGARRSPRARIRLHVCWGNYEGPHDDDVALREILPILLEANVGEGAHVAVRESAS